MGKAPGTALISGTGDAGAAVTGAAGTAACAAADSVCPPECVAVAVPDHQLLRRIGRGAYGEVWLAVNVMGVGRAVKIVKRGSFSSDRPFDREFAALKRYEPVSRSADGLVNVLHAGRSEDHSHFYYVMELADAHPGGNFTRDKAGDYQPRTLSSEMTQMGGRLPLTECLSHAHMLTLAVASLHAVGLTHRDIKPSNIIFVHNRPKLADIGLVDAVGESRSFVGTEGFIPPEGPGQPGADLYALGMVCYVMATGFHPTRFPQLPKEWLQPGHETELEFMEIIMKATEASAERRYQVAVEMLADLALVQSGGSVRRFRQLEHRWRWMKRMAAAAAAVMLVTGGGMWVWQHEKTRAARMAAAEELTTQAQAGEREQRFLALRDRAAATLRSPMAGSGAETLRAIDEAATLHPEDPSLRDLLVTALTRADFTAGKSWTHDDPFMAPCVSADGRLVALIEKGGGIRIEKTDDRSVAGKLHAWAGTRPWSRWRFTPDGMYLGVDYNNSLVPAEARFRWWRVSDGSVAWEGNPGMVSLGGVPAEGHVITGYDSAAGMLIRFDLDARREVNRRALVGTGTDFVLSPDGRRAVFFTGGGDFLEGLVFVDTGEARCLREVPVKFMNRSVAWLPDSRHLLVGGSAVPVEVMVLASDDAEIQFRPMRMHSGPIVDVQVSPDGQYLLTASWDQTTWLTQLSDGVPLALAPGWGGTGSGGFSKDGKHLWRSRMGDLAARPELLFSDFQQPVVSTLTAAVEERKIERCYFSPDGSELLAMGDGLTVYDLKTGRPPQRLMEDQEVQSCAFVRDGLGTALLCGCAEGLFRLRPRNFPGGGGWDLERRLAAGDFDEVVASGDGRVAIAYGTNVRSRTLRNGWLLPWPSAPGVTSAAMSGDGSMAAYVAGRGKLSVQNPWGLTLAQKAVPEKSWVSLSPDGKCLFLNEPNAIYCLDPRDLTEIWRFPKEFPNIRGAPVLMTSSQLILAKTGLQFALLDAVTGALRCRLNPVFPFNGKNAAFSPDGSRLAIHSANSLLLWNVEQLRAELRKRGMDW